MKTYDEIIRYLKSYQELKYDIEFYRNKMGGLKAISYSQEEKGTAQDNIMFSYMQKIEDAENEMKEIEKFIEDNFKGNARIIIWNKYIKMCIRDRYKHVRLTDSEYEKLKHDFPFYQDLITKLDEYIETSGKTYKNHNLVLRGWVLKWYKENHEIGDLVENETFSEQIDNPIVDSSDLSELLNKFKNGEIQ